MQLCHGGSVTVTGDGTGEASGLGEGVCLSILREMPDGLVLISSEGECRYLNPAFTRITGYTREDVPTLAMWFERAHPNPAYRQKVQVLGQELFSGEQEVLVASVVCRNGRMRELELRRASVGDGSVIFTVRDVTEQALTEERLRQASSELTVVIDAFPDLFIKLNADGTILDFRKGMPAEVPFVSRAHLGRRVQDLLPAEVGKAFLGALQTVVQTNAPGVPLEFSRTEAGGVRHYEVRVVPLYELHLMAIIREITERKKAEEELHRHREHLEELVAERAAELKRANQQLEQLLYYIEMTERKAAEGWLDSLTEHGTLGVDEPEEAGITTDAAGLVVIVDMAAELLTGYAGNELAGKPVWSLFSDDKVREVLVREVLEQGKPAECAMGAELVKHDGSKEIVRVSGDPIADKAGTVIGMVCTLKKL